MSNNESTNDFAQRVQAEANDYEPKLPQDAIADETPALANVAPEFAEAQEDVDLSTLPAFKGMNHLMASQRMGMKLRLVEIASTLPEEMRDGKTNVSIDADSPDENTLEALKAITEMLSKCESLLLDIAANPEDMREWLSTQESAEQATMAAFTVAAERLGN